MAFKYCFFHKTELKFQYFLVDFSNTPMVLGKCIIFVIHTMYIYFKLAEKCTRKITFQPAALL